MAGHAGGYPCRIWSSTRGTGSDPTTQIPLIIIDRTFVPDAAQMTAAIRPGTGEETLRVPGLTREISTCHAYMPEPDATGMRTAMGRWYMPINPSAGQATPPPAANPDSHHQLTHRGNQH